MKSFVFRVWDFSGIEKLRRFLYKGDPLSTLPISDTEYISRQ